MLLVYLIAVEQVHKAGILSGAVESSAVGGVHILPGVIRNDGDAGAVVFSQWNAHLKVSSEYAVADNAAPGMPRLIVFLVVSGHSSSALVVYRIHAKTDLEYIAVVEPAVGQVELGDQRIVHETVPVHVHGLEVLVHMTEQHCGKAVSQLQGRSHVAGQAIIAHRVQAQEEGLLVRNSQ